SHSFSVGTPAHVSAACDAAEAAFPAYSAKTRGERAAFLNRIADEIEVRGPQITEIGTQETGLPAARLEGERGRTVMQLRLFATHILKDDWLDRRRPAQEGRDSFAALARRLMLARNTTELLGIARALHGIRKDLLREH
ncbi:MAG: aldehyde dehydrogenase family protein, partial [Sphingopyxis sp.]|nr:aldehyde dehydrogenase family protein [Sphingopyxis sp.]